MNYSVTEKRFEEFFKKLFPNINISSFRYGNFEQVNFVHYLIPPENKHLIGSEYYQTNDKLLSHFTSMIGVQSIIGTKTIRLYNLNNLNDPREYTYAGKLNYDIERLKDAKENLFVLSLVNIDPSQKKFMSTKFNMWRLYGEDGKGCLIEFDFSKSDPQLWRDFYLSRIHYSLSKKANIKKLENYISRINKKENKIGIDLGQLTCFHKSGLFSIEKEYRLLYDARIKKGIGNRNIRDYNNRLLFPKIRIDIFKSTNTKIQFLELPIYHSDFVPIDIFLPVLNINSITIGYKHKNEYNEIKKDFEILCEDNLGYVPEIKLSTLTKTYWG